jgi:hypothetical protein
MDGAIVSAVAALGGVALSQGFGLLQTVLTRKQAKAGLLRQKLEELAEHLTASLAWTEQALTRTTRADGSEAVGGDVLPLPARRAYALALLYFPELTGVARRHMVASNNYLAMLNRAATDNTPETGEEVLHWASELALAREAFDKGIERCAASVLAG